MLSQILLPDEDVLSRIYRINNLKVMMDFDLAELYEIPTKRLNEQVKRNLDRFPKEFIIKLGVKELRQFRSQNATANLEMRRTKPYAFTEHGILMLSSVLNNKKAVQVNSQLMRIFTKMRELLLNQNDLFQLIKQLEDRMNHNDEKLDGLVLYLQRFLKTNERGEIGYKPI
jgi:phage regulator Rha-like protein